MADTKKPFKVIKIKEYGEFHLCEPTFDVYAKAVTKSKMVMGDEADIVSSGRVIFESCYVGNNLPIKEIAKNVPLFVKLSMLSFEIIGNINIEVEKK